MKKLIVIIVSILLASELSAYQVEMTAPEAACSAGSPVTIGIQVYPASPRQTTMHIESVPDSFTLVGSRKERQVKEDPSGFSEDNVSAVLFIQEWIAEKEGTYRIGPFIIEVDGVEQVLAPVTVFVRAGEIPGSGEIRWIIDAEQGSFRVGEPVRLVLESRRIFEPVSLSVPLQENALLERIKDPGTSDAPFDSWSIAAVYMWTPLSAGTLELPGARIEYRDKDGSGYAAHAGQKFLKILESSEPGVAESVSPLLSAAFQGTYPEETREENPASDVRLPDSLAAAVGEDVRSAADAWKRGNIAESLAVLRHLEYSSLFPAPYRGLRRDAEAHIGIITDVSVVSLPVTVLLISLCAFSLCIAFISFLFRKRSRTAALSFTLSAVVCILLLGSACMYGVPLLHPAAVSRHGMLSQIPEETASIQRSIPEGTPVRVLSRTGDWFYVRLPDNAEGWVPYDTLIPYTRSVFYEFW